jgi:hypothetical protein
MSTVILANLMSRKRQVLQLLSDLARAQLTVIEAGDTSRLLRVLSAKQPLAEELQRVDSELAPFREEDPEARVWTSLDARKQCQADALACEQLLTNVLRLEQTSEAALVAQRDETSRQLEVLDAAQHAHQAYGGYEAAPMSQIDFTADR